MKKLMILTISFITVIFLSSCETSEYIDDVESITEEIVLLEINEDSSTSNYYDYDVLWGNEAALSSDSLSLEEMLIYAIEDEYSAYAEYRYILDNFDVTKPFSNIINAELSHIEMLLPLFETYKLTIPYDDSSNHLIVVVDLEDTFRTGVIAEVLNIDMYNLFLEYDLPKDVRDVFIGLRDASIKHLAAFEKNLEKY